MRQDYAIPEGIEGLEASGERHCSGQPQANQTQPFPRGYTCAGGLNGERSEWLLLWSWLLPLLLVLLLFYLAQQGHVPTFNLAHNKKNYIGGSDRLDILLENLSCLAVYAWLTLGVLLLLFLLVNSLTTLCYNVPQLRKAVSPHVSLPKVDNLRLAHQQTDYHDNLALMRDLAPA